MTSVTVISSPLSYSEFYKEFILRNKPCLFSKLFTNNWLCRKKWVLENDVPNIEFLKEKYGDLTAPVLDCNEVYFSSHKKCDMLIGEYFDYWKNRENKILYLKDWHLQRDNQQENFYDVPIYFSSDWLNEFWDSRNIGDDYRFVYIGVQGSWTPFHADVFQSYSWSANICGLKEWYLCPPGDEEYLRDIHGNLPLDITKTNVDPKLYPNWDKAKQIKLLQHSGEIIFIPSGWHHQVVNKLDTISINHNWVNAGCIRNMYYHLHHELQLVTREISDCKQMDGFHQQCQLILNASAGIDYNGFFDMILFLLKQRLNVLEEIYVKKTCQETLLHSLSRLRISFKPNLPYNLEGIDIQEEIKYIKFDLCKLKSIADLIVTDRDFQLVIPSEKMSKLHKLRSSIEIIKTKLFKVLSFKTII